MVIIVCTFVRPNNNKTRMNSIKDIAKALNLTPSEVSKSGSIYVYVNGAEVRISDHNILSHNGGYKASGNIDIVANFGSRNERGERKLYGFELGFNSVGDWTFNKNEEVKELIYALEDTYGNDEIPFEQVKQLIEML